MNTKITNTTDMVDELILVCDGNSPAISSIPALETAYTGLKAKRVVIKDTAMLQENVITGYATQKRVAKELCVKKILKVSKSLVAYGHIKGDNPLVESMKFSASALGRMRAAKLVLVGWNVFNAATALSSDIVDYGTEAADLSALENAIKEFTLLIPEPKEARDIRKGCTAKLRVLTKETNTLLKKVMDPLIVVLDEAYADFIVLYFNARSITDVHGKKKKAAPVTGVGILSGTVCNSEDSGAIEEASVTIVEPDLTVTTDEDGYYYFESVPAGTYTLKVKAATYLDETVTDVEILPNSEVTKDVALNSDVEGSV